jgi:hypothetical protein
MTSLSVDNWTGTYRGNKKTWISGAVAQLGVRVATGKEAGRMEPTVRLEGF